MTSYGGRDYDYNNGGAGGGGYGQSGHYDQQHNPYDQQQNPYDQQQHSYDQQQHGYGNSYGGYGNNNNNYGQRPQIPQTNHYDPNNPVYDLDDISNGFPAFAGPGATVKSIVEDQYGNTKEDTVTRLHPMSSDDSAFGVPGGMTTISVLVVVSLVCLLIFVFGLLTLLKKRGPDADAIQYGGGAGFHGRYMVSDRCYWQIVHVLNILEWIQDDDKDVDCLNCRLIEMGSMACYQELCPQCGRPPPR